MFPFFNGGLASPSSFSHSGALGTYWWADPERELVGVYLSVSAREGEHRNLFAWKADLFVGAVTAAVEE